MSHGSQRLLDAALFAHYEASKHLLGGSLEAFSERMVELNDSLPAHLRTNAIASGGDLFARMDSNGKKLRRYQDTRTQHRMPAELVFLFVETMRRTEPLAGVACATEVCRLMGSLYVPVPQGSVSADIATVGTVAKRFAGYCESWAPIIADGLVNGCDYQFLDDAIDSCDELIAAVTSSRALLVSVRAKERERREHLQLIPKAA